MMFPRTASAQEAGGHAVTPRNRTGSPSAGAVPTQHAEVPDPMHRRTTAPQLRHWNPTEPRPGIAPLLGPGLLAAIFSRTGARLSPWAPLVLTDSGHNLLAAFTGEDGWDPAILVVWDGNPDCHTWLSMPYVVADEVHEGDDVTVMLPNLSGP